MRKKGKHIHMNGQTRGIVTLYYNKLLKMLMYGNQLILKGIESLCISFSTQYLVQW